jgi:hypothetical protein
MVDFFSNSIATQLMLFVSAVCILLRVLAVRRYKHLCRQGEDLALAGDQALKQLRVRFEGTYRLNQGHVHASTLVAHQMQGYRIWGIPIRYLEQAPRHSALFCLGLGICGCGYLTVQGQAVLACAQMLFWGLGLGIFNLLMANLVGGYSMGDLQVCLTDYLEHTLAARLSMEQAHRNGKDLGSKMRDDLFMKKEEPQETGLELYQGQAVPVEEPEDDAQYTGRRLTPREERLIADVLKEYLAGRY